MLTMTFDQNEALPELDGDDDLLPGVVALGDDDDLLPGVVALGDDDDDLLPGVVALGMHDVEPGYTGEGDHIDVFGLGEDGSLAQPTKTGRQIWWWLGGILSLAGAGTGAYHGYKRNHESVGWAIGWGLLGGLVPIITIPVSLAQGFGQPKKERPIPVRVVRGRR
jgi:hypothetical protein